MAWNLRRSKKIAPGIRLNLSKKGLGLSLGPRHSKISVSPGKRVTANLGVPGTGVRYTKVLNPKNLKTRQNPQIEQAVPYSTNAEIHKRLTIPYDSHWIESWKALNLQRQGLTVPVDLSIHVADDLLSEIWSAIEKQSSSTRVPYSNQMRPINIDRESFHQEWLSEFCDHRPAESIPWSAGFLAPELASPNYEADVAVYAFKKDVDRSTLDPSSPLVDSENAGSISQYRVLHVGYLEKESAQKVHKDIINLMGQDRYIPLLVKISGGSSQKPFYGVSAYAMCDKVDF